MAGNLGHIAATVSLNIDPFKASAKALNSTIKATAAEMKALDAANKGNEQSVNGMKASYSAMSRQLDNYKAKLKTQKQTYEEAAAAAKKEGSATSELTAKQANAASAYNRTAAQSAKLQQEMAQLNKHITLQESGWTKASVGAAKFASVTNTMSTKLSSFGRTMTMGVTTPIVAGLGAAAKSAVSFHSEIDSIGPLLTNGAAVTGKFKTELNQMASASKSWATQYGISTNSINQGMADLVRAGYSAKQTMAMMPAILDASRASGEDFNTVMDVVTSTMTQFGVKAKNTTTVTDAMTYAANATKSGFADMGEAMKYTGASANSAGISLNTTVAALGLLSNAGLQGTQAGTSFNMMIQKLASASAAANSPMSKLGVNVAAFKKGQIGLPEVIDQVTKGTKNMSDANRVAALNAAFGERGGRAMLALMKAGGPALTSLTKKTEEAAGATKKVSDQMGGTAQAQFNRFKSSVQVLGITLGEKLLPAITPLIQKATEMVNKFAKLDSGTQQSIIKFGLLAAAIGPVSSLLGGVFKVASVGSTAFSAVAGGIGRATSAAKLGGTGMQVLKSAFSKTSFEAMNFAGKAGTAAAATEGMAGSSVGLLAALGTAVPVIAGVTLAVGAGVAVWELWGKKVYESSQRTSKWGSDIGKSADDAASKFKDYEGTVTHALSDTSQSASDNAKSISSAFDGMAASTDKAAKKQYQTLKKLASDLGGSAGRNLMAVANQEKSANEKRVKTLESYAAKVKVITQKSRDDNVKLTAEQNQVIQNYQQKAAAAQVKTLGLSQKQQTEVLKVELNARTNLSKTEAENLQWDTEKAAGKEVASYRNKMSQIKSTLTKGTKEYSVAVEGLEADHNSKMNALGVAQIKAMKERGVSMSTITRNMLKNGWSQSEIDSALSAYKKALSGATDSTKSFAATVKDNMSSAAKKAGNSWNSLVLDPKTGKVKTNLPDVLKDAANTDKGWKSLNFDLKHAKITSNAKQAIVDAMAASEKWKSMPTWEKTAIIKTQGKDELARVMTDFEDWNSFSLQDQQAIVHGDYQPLIDALLKDGQWNDMTLDEQKAVAHDYATAALVTALGSMGEWNKLTVEQKQAILHDKATASALQAIAATNMWNSITPDAKDAIINAKGLSGLAEAVVKFGIFDQMPKSVQKELMADDKASAIIGNATGTLKQYNSITPGHKVATGDTTSVVTQFNKGMQQVKFFAATSPGPTKVAMGQDSASAAMANATRGTSTFAHTSTGPAKNAQANDYASPSLKSATRSTNTFRGTSVGSTKIARAVDYASGNAYQATSAVREFSRQGNHTVRLTTIFDKITNFITHRRAKGDRNFQGGLATVNDQQGGTFREAIHLPSGETFIPHGRNVTLDLPRGTQIVPARQTARLFKIPQFATGTADYSRAVYDINRMQMDVVRTAPVPADLVQSGIETDNSNLLSRQISLLGQIASELAAASDPHVTVQVMADTTPQTIKKIQTAVVDGITKSQNARKRAVGGA